MLLMQICAVSADLGVFILVLYDIHSVTEPLWALIESSDFCTYLVSILIHAGVQDHGLKISQGEGGLGQD